MSATLLSGASISLLAAFVFFYVGHRLSRRVSRARVVAGRAFVLWWFLVAAYILVWNVVTVVLTAAGAGGVVHLVVLRVVSYLILCGALASLMVYLTYLYTGSRLWVVPLVLFYSALFVSLVYLVLSNSPVDVDVRRWRVGIEYERSLGALYYVLASLLILPTVVGALAYFALRFKTRDPYMRFRITLVSWSIIVWTSSSLLARVSEHDWSQIVTRSVIGLVAALVILFAYDTPAVVRRRFGAPDVEEVADGFQEELQTRRQAVKRRRRQELEYRIEDLI